MPDDLIACRLPVFQVVGHAGRAETSARPAKIASSNLESNWANKVIPARPDVSGRAEGAREITGKNSHLIQETWRGANGALPTLFDVAARADRSGQAGRAETSARPAKIASSNLESNWTNKVKPARPDVSGRAEGARHSCKETEIVEKVGGRQGKIGQATIR
jgi:hypothetical protein